MNWSGGKDSALCLYKAIQQGLCAEALVTNVNSVHDRISMHGVRNELLDQQAKAIGLPLSKTELPEEPGMQEYEKIMEQKISELKEQGFTHSMFGDIFLEDLKRYREEQLQKQNITCLFPLWKIDTKELMREFLSLGFKAIIVCVNERFLDKNFCGRMIDQSFIDELPANVDVCGENGEYHSFVYDGPLFKNPVTFVKGEIVYRKYPAPKNAADNCFATGDPTEYGFYFCDLLPQ